MSSEDNVKVVRSAYDAFGRGDIPAVLDILTDDCDWGVDSSAAIAPYYGIRHGVDGVLAFFQDLGATFELEQFDPVAMAGHDDDVLAVVAYGIKSTATGKSGRTNIHHHFKLRGGKISYFRGTEDAEMIKGLLAG